VPASRTDGLARRASALGASHTQTDRSARRARLFASIAHPVSSPQCPALRGLLWASSLDAGESDSRKIGGIRQYCDGPSLAAGLGFRRRRGHVHCHLARRAGSPHYPVPSAAVGRGRHNGAAFQRLRPKCDGRSSERRARGATGVRCVVAETDFPTDAAESVPANAAFGSYRARPLLAVPVPAAHASSIKSPFREGRKVAAP